MQDAKTVQVSLKVIEWRTNALCWMFCIVRFEFVQETISTDHMKPKNSQKSTQLNWVSNLSRSSNSYTPPKLGCTWQNMKHKRNHLKSRAFPEQNFDDESIVVFPFPNGTIYWQGCTLYDLVAVQVRISWSRSSSWSFVPLPSNGGSFIASTSCRNDCFTCVCCTHSTTSSPIAYRTNRSSLAPISYDPFLRCEDVPVWNIDSKVPYYQNRPPFKSTKSQKLDVRNFRPGETTSYFNLIPFLVFFRVSLQYLGSFFLLGPLNILLYRIFCLIFLVRVPELFVFFYLRRSKIHGISVVFCVISCN